LYSSINNAFIVPFPPPVYILLIFRESSTNRGFGASHGLFKKLIISLPADLPGSQGKVCLKHEAVSKSVILELPHIVLKAAVPKLKFWDSNLKFQNN
jgi:hypothetical protein